MRKSHFIMTTLVILSLCASAFAADAPGTPAPGGVVNINTADAAHLSYLPRIGVKAAQRIIEYRTQHGAFHKTSDLMQVKGFGEKRFNQVSSYVTVDGKTTLNAKISAPRKSRKSASRQQPTTTASK